MFEARLVISRKTTGGIIMSWQDILDMAKKVYPDAFDAVVLVESGGEGQPKGSSKMTLRCWNKENGYHARYVPITSTPRVE